MVKAPYGGVFVKRNSQIWEILQQIDMIEKSNAKTLCRPWMIPPGPKHDRFQVG
jgi:hypothetical protein